MVGSSDFLAVRKYKNSRMEMMIGTKYVQYNTLALPNLGSD